MRFHTIHLPGVNLVDQQINKNPSWYQIDGAVAIKEGFCWPAFLFSLVWAIFYRLWKFAFYLIVINLILLTFISQLGASYFIIFVSLLGVSILFGYMANDARRSNLNKRGYLEKIVLIAPTKHAAIRRYLDICVSRR